MFNPLMESVVLQLDQWLPQEASVVEFGNQRYGGRFGFKSVKEFYESRGFSSYLALDVNTRMDAVVADLNRPVILAGDGQFDLVTNNGTGEHIFNQAMVFENAHNLCKTGGLILHVLPCVGWFEHGFYNYNPVLFNDLAFANDYDVLALFLADRWGNTKAKDNLSVVALFRKKSGEPFRAPVQGKYLKDIESKELSNEYNPGQIQT